MNKRKVGAFFEKVVGIYLAEHGYEILEYNFRCRTGEIDIIARENGFLVFVEVKYRSGLGRGDPLEAVDKRKQHTISRVAAHYCLIRGYDSQTPCRFDAVAVRGEEIQIVRNAFEYCGYQ